MSMPFRLPRPALNTSPPKNSLSARNARLHPYLALAARFWAVVVGATILGALVAYGLSQLVTPSYTGRSTLYFSIGYGASGSDLNQGATYAQGQMLSFAELARSERVLEPVVTGLELPITTNQLADQIEVTTPANTVVLNISAASRDPEVAAAIANRVAQSLTIAVLDVAPRDADGKATVSVRTVETATPPTVPSAPNTRVNTVAGVLIGLVLSLVLITALQMLDTRLRDPRGVAAAGGLPVLARLRSSSADAFAVDPSGAAAEDYRRLVATLDAVHRNASHPAAPPAAGTKNARAARVFVVASVAAELAQVDDRGRLDDATPGTAPTALSRAAAVVANLAIAAAEAGHRVAVLAEGAAELTGADDSDVHVTTRPLPANGRVPAALLNSHDLVLIAAPGGADGSRALRLAQAADGVVLIAEEGRVHIGELREAIDLFHTVGARVAGTVLAVRTSRVESRGAQRQGAEERSVEQHGAEDPEVGDAAVSGASAPRGSQPGRSTVRQTTKKAARNDLPGVLEQNKA